MIKGGQRERLLDYSHILIATIEMFYEILNLNFNYRLTSKFELDENVQIRY